MPPGMVGFVARESMLPPELADAAPSAAANRYDHNRPLRCSFFLVIDGWLGRLNERPQPTPAAPS